MSGLTLALPFDTDEPEFRRGVEIGMLWAMTGERVPGIAEARGLPFAAEPAGDDWLAVTIGIPR